MDDFYNAAPPLFSAGAPSAGQRTGKAGRGSCYAEQPMATRRSTRSPPRDSTPPAQFVRADLTQAQWERIEPLIPSPRRRSDGRGRPWRDAREILSAIFWILGTGAHWRDLPACYPPYQTCHRRFQQWIGDGTIERVLVALATGLNRDEASAPGAWPSASAAAFFSPQGSPVLRRMRSGKPQRHSDRPSPPLQNA